MIRARVREAVKAYGLVRCKYQWKDYDEWFRKYGPAVDIEAYADYGTLLTYFDGLGVLVKKRLIDVSLVEDLFSQRIIWFWETHMAPTIDTTRAFTSDPTQYEHIEYLYHALKQRQQATVS